MILFIKHRMINSLESVWMVHLNEQIQNNDVFIIVTNIPIRKDCCNDDYCIQNVLGVEHDAVEEQND